VKATLQLQDAYKDDSKVVNHVADRLDTKPEIYQEKTAKKEHIIFVLQSGRSEQFPEFVKKVAELINSIDDYYLEKQTKAESEPSVSDKSEIESQPTQAPKAVEPVKPAPKWVDRDQKSVKAEKTKSEPKKVETPAQSVCSQPSSKPIDSLVASPQKDFIKASIVELEQNISDYERVCKLKFDEIAILEQSLREAKELYSCLSKKSEFAQAQLKQLKSLVDLSAGSSAVTSTLPQPADGQVASE
jgi:hypothetical protein